MKKLICCISITVWCLVVSLPVFAIELSIERLKNEEYSVPGSYAKVITVLENGIEVEKIVFSGSSTFYGPKSLNNILEAYGVSLSIDALKDKKNRVPKSFAKIVKDEDDIEMIVFSNSSTFYGPKSLNNILEAYGVSLSMDALKDKKNRVPKSFAKIVKDENDKEKIVFSDSFTFYGPKSLNNILEAYKHF